jgi:hypothetical protein
MRAYAKLPLFEDEDENTDKNSEYIPQRNSDGLEATDVEEEKPAKKKAKVQKPTMRETITASRKALASGDVDAQEIDMVVRKQEGTRSHNVSGKSDGKMAGGKVAELKSAGFACLIDLLSCSYSTNQHFFFIISVSILTPRRSPAPLKIGLQMS